MRPSRDIVVVGAGVVGCAIASELARRGASVEIIDDRGPGLGATQASAGMLAPYNEALEGGPLLELASRSLDLYDSFVARTQSDAGLPVTYRRTGTLEVALQPAALPRLTRAHALLRRTGVACEWLDPAQVKAQEPALADVAGGLLLPDHGYVAATELTRALAAAARRHGARIIEHGRVQRIVRRGDDVDVVTDRGSLTADAVVLAAGSWSGGVAVDGASPAPVTPVRGQLLQLQWSGPRLTRVLWCEQCYVVPWDDGTVLVGATVEDVGFDERTTVSGVRQLLDAITAVSPEAPSARFVAARSGLRPATPDHLPIIGRSAAMPALVYATGHFRNGVLLAPLTAQMVADLVLDERSDPQLTALAPSRFGQL